MKEKDYIPAPGDYHITNNILKKPNPLGNAYSYYKNLNQK